MHQVDTKRKKFTFWETHSPTGLNKLFHHPPFVYCMKNRGGGRFTEVEGSSFELSPAPAKFYWICNCRGSVSRRYKHASCLVGCCHRSLVAEHCWQCCGVWTDCAWKGETWRGGSIRATWRQQVRQITAGRLLRRARWRRIVAMPRRLPPSQLRDQQWWEKAGPCKVRLRLFRYRPRREKRTCSRRARTVTWNGWRAWSMERPWTHGTRSVASPLHFTSQLVRLDVFAVVLAVRPVAKNFPLFFRIWSERRGGVLASMWSKRNGLWWRYVTPSPYLYLWQPLPELALFVTFFFMQFLSHFPWLMFHLFICLFFGGPLFELFLFCSSHLPV